jgi:hypothetical protein
MPIGLRAFWLQALSSTDPLATDLAEPHHDDLKYSFSPVGLRMLRVSQLDQGNYNNNVSQGRPIMTMHRSGSTRNPT